jgi:outer membrane protein TolC
MTRRNWLHRIACITALLGILSGCMPQQPHYLFEDGDLSHYIDRATDIEYADVDEPTLGEVEGAAPPLSLQNTEPNEVWDLTLEEAVQIALANGKVLKSLGGTVVGPPESLVRNPELAQTVYDPAIFESDPRQGVEAALSAFDAQFSTSVFWEQNDTPQNVSGFVEAFRPLVFQQETGNFTAEIQKTAATGGTMSIRHNAAYAWDNTTTKAYSSDWNVNIEAEMRQPLLQGYGVQFNRIAGPGAIPGFYNGVMIARINTDIALADFEANVRNMVGDVETAYWELYYAYRQLDAVIAGRDSALVTWRRIYILYKQGARGGEAEKEAQAREQYFQFRSAVEESLQNLYNTEAKLRYLLGLAATDGRLIRPADEPTTAKVVFDWREALSEALVQNTELREQRWVVKRRELELIASKNFLLPRLDVVGNYTWQGLGDDLIEANRSGLAFNQPGSNAWESLTGDGLFAWQLGVELNMPIGFRKELAGVRNAQLLLARERAKLQEQELELSHQLAYYLRELESKFVLSQTNWNRRVAAQRQVDAVAEAYETGTVTIDVLLEAQRRLAVAESDYFRSVVDYNEAITQVHLRKGSLLEYNGVFLAEGPWPAKAYFDAHRRARARDASVYLDYGFTRPSVISRGPGRPTAAMPEGEVIFEGDAPMPPGLIDGSGVIEGTEAIPTPAPELVLPPDELPQPPEPSGDPQASLERARSSRTTTAPGTQADNLPRTQADNLLSDAATGQAGRGGQKLAKRQSLRPVEGKFKLESLDGLTALAEPSQEPLAPRTAKTKTAKASTRSGWTAVQRASYEEPAAVQPTRRSPSLSLGGTNVQWVSPKQANSASRVTSTHETDAHSPAIATDRPASSWQGVQR